MLQRYEVLIIVSNSYPPRKGRLLMYYSPVRHSSPKWCVRLACIRHAASVHPEPGSNSPLSYVQTISVLLSSFMFLGFLQSFFFLLTCYCSVFNVPATRFVECLYIIPPLFPFVKSFFEKNCIFCGFLSVFLFLSGFRSPVFLKNVCRISLKHEKSFLFYIFL